MRKLLGLIIILCVSFAAQANQFKGFVKLENGKELYVDLIPPKEGEPLLVVLNGLTYDTESWNQEMPYLVNKGFGILRYDAMGQGETLLKYQNPAKVKKILIEDQAKDLALLFKRMGIKGKVAVMGLSYGGGLALQFAAMYPQHVGVIIAKPPFVAPIPFQHAMISAQVKVTRAMFPHNPLSDEQLYDYYLHNFIYQTFPSADPIVLKNPFLLESAYRMSAGIRHMKYKALLPAIPDKSLHLMIANQDEYLPYDMLDQFWKDTPVSKRGSRIDVDGSKHRMPESIPQYAAAWVVEIMRKNPEISRGRHFYGNAYQGTARCGNILLDLFKLSKK